MSSMEPTKDPEAAEWSDSNTEVKVVERNSEETQSQLESQPLTVHGNVNIAQRIEEHKLYKPVFKYNKITVSQPRKTVRRRKKTVRRRKNTKQSSSSTVVNTEKSAPSQPDTVPASKKGLIAVTFSLLAIFISIGLGYYFYSTSPPAKRKGSAQLQSHETKTINRNFSGTSDEAVDETILFIEACRSGDVSRVIDIFYKPPPSFNINGTDAAGDTGLHFACSGGHVSIATLLLGRGAFVNSSNKLGRSPLHEASRNGHSNVVKLLCEHGANVNATDFRGTTPLAEASEYGRKHVVKILIDHNADINMLSHHDSNKRPKPKKWHLNVPKLPEFKLPLMSAVMQGYDEIVELYLKNGAQVNAYNGTGWSEIHFASYNGNLSIVEMLLAHGALVDAETEVAATPLLLASQEGHVDVVSYLLKQGAKVNHTQQDGATSVMLAAQAGQDSVVNILVQTEAATTAIINGKPTSALQLALSAGHTKTVAYLFDDSLLLDPQMSEDLLLLASFKGEVRVVQWLLKKGTNVECKQKETEASPLMMAAMNGQADVVRVLLKHGAKPTATTGDGSINPLIAAIILGRETVVDVILNHVSTDDINSGYGPKQFTPLAYALVKGHMSIFTALLDHGAVPVIQKTKKRSDQTAALCFAVSRKDVLILRTVLERGADANLECQEHLNLITIASVMGPPEMVSILLDYGAKPYLNEPLMSILNYAAYTGKLDLVKLLISRGFDVNSDEKVNNLSITPLLMAAINGQLEVTEILLQHGANADWISEQGTPLGLAALNGDIDFVKLLLQYKSSVDLSNKISQETPLFIASANGYANIVQILLQHGANVNKQIVFKMENLDSNPLLKALKREKIDISVWEQIYKDAAKSQRYVVTNPLYQATILNHSDVVQVLLKNGASTEMKYTFLSHTYTPLHAASMYDLKEIAEILLTNRANVNALDHEGSTSLHLAVRSRNPDIIHLLLKYGAVDSVKNENGLTAWDEYTFEDEVDVDEALVSSVINKERSKLKEREKRKTPRT